MKQRLAALMLVGASLTANGQDASIDARLSALEFKTAKFISGKEKIAAGYVQMPPHIRAIACRAYPVQSDVEAIEGYKKEIAALDAADSPAISSDEQARLTALQSVIAGLTAGIDCTKLS